MTVASLVDTNVLVYRFDARFPRKRQIATELLRTGIAQGSLRVPHQAIVAGWGYHKSIHTRPLQRFLLLQSL